MAQIDLTQVPAQFSIDGPIQKTNFFKMIGDTIYRHAISVKMDEFAKRLYHAEGPVEVSEEELEWIRTIGLSECAYFIREAVTKLLPAEKNPKE